MSDDELKALFEGLRRENTIVRDENAEAHQETRRHFDVVAADTRRHFDVVAERIETRFDLLAETVEHVNAELERTRTSLNEKIEQSAAETQAMIKFSHKELDRRVTTLEEGQRALEETVADLQTRVHRIESTH